MAIEKLKLVLIQRCWMTTEDAKEDIKTEEVAETIFKTVEESNM